ncbi:hypothetical protein NS506_03481 [Nocardia seriolae]|uniref:Uncharacterized protein n=1 Tax=Nocardia seriolae TaxID=37332 RepID=A0ABC8ATT9_9NOCA|nr:hypothetical protein NS506_03481 [Nocardia seriolae]
MSALAELVLVLLSCAVGVAAARWGIAADTPPVTSAPGGPLLVADGRVFHRVPVANLHRLHGRHRA